MFYGGKTVLDYWPIFRTSITLYLLHLELIYTSFAGQLWSSAFGGPYSLPDRSKDRVSVSFLLIPRTIADFRNSKSESSELWTFGIADPNQKNLNLHHFEMFHIGYDLCMNKKAQLSLTKPRDAKACQKLLQFESTCLQRWRWHYWSIFIRLAVAASEICEIPRNGMKIQILENSLKIQTYRVQGHPRSSILVPIKSAYVLSY